MSDDNFWLTQTPNRNSFSSTPWMSTLTPPLNKKSQLNMKTLQGGSNMPLTGKDVPSLPACWALPTWSCSALNRSFLVSTIYFIYHLSFFPHFTLVASQTRCLFHFSLFFLTQELNIYS